MSLRLILLEVDNCYDCPYWIDGCYYGQNKNASPEEPPYRLSNIEWESSGGNIREEVDPGCPLPEIKLKE